MEAKAGTLRILSKWKLWERMRSLPFPTWVTSNSCPLPTVTVSIPVVAWECNESWNRSGVTWLEQPASVSQLVVDAEAELAVAAIELAAIKANLAGAYLPW